MNLFTKEPNNVCFQKKSKPKKIVIKIPDSYQLFQNFPNPFNNQTLIRIDLPQETDVKLQIINSAGQVVRDYSVNHLTAGTHTFIWNGKDDHQNSLTSGIYFYRLMTRNYQEIKKMILIK